eukprot:gene609-1173_t
MHRLPKEDRLIIGKFRDPVKLNNAQPPIYMQEDLEEDVQDIAEEKYIGEKGAEYYRRRRVNRFRRKTQITIEDSTKKSKDSTSGIKLSGLPVENRTEGGGTSKYVLLQVLKVGDTSEVNVIPVDDWYQFHKVSTSRAISLDEVDLEYDNLQRRKASANKKYQRISKAMDHNSRIYDETVASKLNGGGSSGQDGETGGSDAFGMAAAKFMKIKKSKETKVDVKQYSMVDADGEKEFEDICGYEYEETRSDDEEDAVLEQADQEVEAERAVVMQKDEDEEADEDDEDEDEEAEGDEEEGDGGELVLASKQLKGFLTKQNEKGASESSGEEDAESTSSRGREDGGDGRAEDRKRRREEDSGDQSKKSKGDPGDKKGSLTLELELSEEGMRAYMARMGGRLTAKSLVEAFKKQIRDAPSGKERFAAIAKKITMKAEDPVLGKILILKQR